MKVSVRLLSLLLVGSSCATQMVYGSSRPEDIKIPQSGGLPEADPMAFNRELITPAPPPERRENNPVQGLLDGHIYGPRDPLDVEGFVRREFR